MNRKPAAPANLAAGHVTIAVLPEPPGVDLDAALTDPALPDVVKQGLITPAPALLDKLRRFLDKRRLITTRIHLASPPQLLPKLVLFTLTATVIVDRDRSLTDMTASITSRIRALLGVVSGGFDGTGWPMGGNVYRSEAVPPARGHRRRRSRGGADARTGRPERQRGARRPVPAGDWLRRPRHNRHSRLRTAAPCRPRARICSTCPRCSGPPTRRGATRFSDAS